MKQASKTYSGWPQREIHEREDPHRTDGPANGFFATGPRCLSNL
jgi:hypothetical protein